MDGGLCLQPEVCTYLGKARSGEDRKGITWSEIPNGVSRAEPGQLPSPGPKPETIPTAYCFHLSNPKRVVFPSLLAFTKAASQDLVIKCPISPLLLHF